MTIKTTRWSPDTCDCVIEYEWDTETSEDNRVFTLSNYVNTCPQHTNISDHVQKYNTVKNENTKKNGAYQLALDNIPSQYVDILEDGTRTLKRGITFSWTWSGVAPDRVLTITFQGIELTQQQKTAIQNFLNNKFGINNVIIN